MQLWDAFLEDYRDRVFNWSPRQLLEVFWYYCQDGNKAVFEFLNKDAVLIPVEDRQAKPCRFKDDACRLGPDYPCGACAVYSPAS